MTLLKTLVVALAAATAASAIPANPSNSQPTSFTTVVKPTSTSAAAAPAATADQKGLFADLFTAATAIQRFRRILLDGAGNLLSGDALRKAVVFDFTGSAKETGKGGKIAKADIETFPILGAAGLSETDSGISTTVVFLNACGINTPHIHPRASEFLTVTQGTVDFGMILENGLTTAPGASNEITGTLGPIQGTVFPQGSIHYQFNPTCDPATFVATLNSVDAGTSQIAQNYLGLNGDVVSASLGFPDSTIAGQDIAVVRKQLPANLVQGVEKCLKKCGL